MRIVSQTHPLMAMRTGSCGAAADIFGENAGRRRRAERLHAREERTQNERIPQLMGGSGSDETYIMGAKDDNDAP